MYYVNCFVGNYPGSSYRGHPPRGKTIPSLYLVTDYTMILLYTYTIHLRTYVQIYTTA